MVSVHINSPCFEREALQVDLVDELVGDQGGLGPVGDGGEYVQY